MLSISKLGLGSCTLVLHNSTFGPGSSKLVLGNWISVCCWLFSALLGSPQLNSVNSITQIIGYI